MPNWKGESGHTIGTFRMMMPWAWHAASSADHVKSSPGQTESQARKRVVSGLFYMRKSIDTLNTCKLLSSGGKNGQNH